MARAIILGSSAALSDADHDYTHFLLSGEGGRAPILVDCGSNPMPKFPIFNIGHEDVGDIILTHYHADHVAGLPNLLVEWWLLGRTTPLRLYGLDHCLSRVENMIREYGWDQMPSPFTIDYIRLPQQNDVRVLENEDFIIRAWQTKHFLPTIGLRVENKLTGRVLAYSCDTEPIPAIVALANGADILIHEAAGAGPGHSSARQAGETAAQAEAGMLYLIHYPPPAYNNLDALIPDAQSAYDGMVVVCEDYDVIEF